MRISRNPYSHIVIVDVITQVISSQDPQPVVLPVSWLSGRSPRRRFNRRLALYPVRAPQADEG